MKKILLFLLFTLSIGNISKAQVTINDSLSNADVANLLTGFGVNISNLVVNCDPAAIGELNGVSIVPIAQGLLLSTGNVNHFNYGPWGSFIDPLLSQFTDTDVNLIVDTLMAPSFDLCKLDFDCVPQGDTLLFNFAFGSEEYPTYVGTQYNDAFGIFLSGPGISGLQNVSQLPNGDFVSINNVNSGINSGYFIANPLPNATGLTYGGFTQNLQVFALTTPGLTYHFKIMITDVGDHSLDSGVLLEAFSFRSPTSAVTALSKTEETQIKLYPNPSHGTLTVKDGNFSGQTKVVSITDMAGRLVQEFALTQSIQQLDLSDIADGVYHINIKNNEAIVNYPLVIKR